MSNDLECPIQFKVHFNGLTYACAVVVALAFGAGHARLNEHGP